MQIPFTASRRKEIPRKKRSSLYKNEVKKVKNIAKFCERVWLNEQRYHFL